MRHGKFQAPRRRISPAIWVVLILAVLGISIGGVRHTCLTPLER